MFASRSANANPDNMPSPPEHAYPLENSERIRLKFGSYGIEVLENSPGIRVSSLHSTHNGINISRTFAVVAYPNVIEPEFQMEHDAIINGQSIGMLFKKNGWLIDKHHQYFGEIKTSPALFNSSSHSDNASTVKSAIHAYTLIIRKDVSEFQYASIAEVHHPDFLRLQDLSEIYGPDFAKHRAKTGSIGEFLGVVESRILALQ